MHQACAAPRASCIVYAWYGLYIVHVFIVDCFVDFFDARRPRWPAGCGAHNACTQGAHRGAQRLHCTLPESLGCALTDGVARRAPSVPVAQSIDVAAPYNEAREDTQAVYL